MKTARRQALSRLGAYAALPALAAAGAAQAQSGTGPVGAPASSPAATAALPSSAQAASSSSPAPSQPSPLPTFAVEIRTGPGWDAKRPPQEQALFREHSAHLRRLREEGHILLGARYSDKGLLVVAAADAAAVRTLFDADPSMQAGTFVYELHPLAVFYGGCVQPPRRRGS